MMSSRRVAAIGAICGAVYATSHAWWTATGPPPFVHAESVIVGGWPLVFVAAAAASVCAGIATGAIARWAPVARWLWCAVGWLTSVLLAAYGLLLAPFLATLLMAPFGYPFDSNDLGALLLQIHVTMTAVLTVISTRSIIRDLRGACTDCGRVHGRSPETRHEPTSWWGYAGGYLAVLGFAVRLGRAVPDWTRDGVTQPDDPGGAAFILFVVLLVLAGTVLPLALVHRWGRVWPAWVSPWAGQNVPRWLVLGPGALMSVGLLAYFGIGGTTALLLGKTSGGVEITGYVVWGAGLAIAASSYARLTRPECPVARAPSEGRAHSLPPASW